LFVKEPLEIDVTSEILRYFSVRRKWELHEYVVPITEDLEFLGMRDAASMDNVLKISIARGKRGASTKLPYAQSSPSRVRDEKYPLKPISSGTGARLWTSNTRNT